MLLPRRFPRCHMPRWMGRACGGDVDDGVWLLNWTSRVWAFELYSHKTVLSGNSCFDAYHPLPTAFPWVKTSEPRSRTDDHRILSYEWRRSICPSTFRQPDRRQRQERNPSRSEEPQVKIFCRCTRLSPSIVFSHTPQLSSFRRCSLAETSIRMTGPTVSRRSVKHLRKRVCYWQKTTLPPLLNKQSPRNWIRTR